MNLLSSNGLCAAAIFSTKANETLELVSEQHSVAPPLVDGQKDRRLIVTTGPFARARLPDFW
jgi:hypothetical protein